MNVAICIPTYNRPSLLREAILSSLEQTRKPDMIVIGDDSPNDLSGKVVADIAAQTDVLIDYKRNHPPLGQNENVNSILDRVTTSHLILLHDDDLLLPNAVEDLSACWDEYPDLTAAFGHQIWISHDGVEDLSGSPRGNAAYHRTPDRAGLQPHDWEVGIAAQFPNNGYMIQTEIAQAVRMRSQEQVGTAVDYDFGLRCSLNYHGFYLVNKYTAKVRATEGGSISGSLESSAALFSYHGLNSLPLPTEAESLRAKRLADLAPRAMMQAIRLGEIHDAWKIYRSPSHGWKTRLTPGGIKRLLMMGRRALHA
jgi:glycosyltransferase involved in cell wall biosynthesis